MQNHIYTFNSEIRIQSKGGAIGNILTLYMVHWVRIFRQKLSEAAANIPSFSLYLSQVYVDDKNISCEALPLGSHLIIGKIQIVEEEIAYDNDIPADIRTSKVICEIGNSISNLLQILQETS